MELSVSPELLARSLARLAHPSDRAWESELNRLRLNASSGVLELEAWNGEVFSRTKVPATIIAEGVAVVPARPFMHLVRSTTVADRIEVRLRETFELDLKRGATTMEINTYTSESWWHPRFSSNSFAHVDLEWIRGLRRILHAAHPEDPKLRCIRWGDGHVIASDRYRMSIISGDFGLGPFLSAASAWKHIADNLAGDAEVSLDDRFVCIRDDTSEYLVTRTHSSYEDRAARVRETSAYSMGFETKPFAEVLRATEFMDADHRIAILYTGGGRAEMFGERTGIGRVTTEIAASGTFRGTVTLDVGALLEIVRSFEADTLDLEIEAVADPVIIRDRNRTHLLMPYIA